MEKLFAPADLRAMHHVRQAFDPAGRLNPAKKLPSLLAYGDCSPGFNQNLPQIPAKSGSANAEDVATQVRLAYQQGQAVYAVGGGTSLNYGLAPAQQGHALSMNLLCGVCDYQPNDMTITVEAGITLAGLNKCLAEHRQWLPLDPPEASKATLGGIVATNASGPRRFAHGTVGDYLLGFRAVDGRGELFSGGGRVVKNAAGYNLPRLMTGSLGRLGVMTQLTFMVRPLPTHSALVICDIPDFPARSVCWPPSAAAPPGRRSWNY